MALKWPLLFVVLFFLNMVAGGEYLIWPAAWILPVLLIWGFRHYTRWYFFWLFVLVLGVSNVITLQGMTPLPAMVEAVFHLLTTLVALIPFWLDRRFHFRNKRFLGTLVLPTAMVLIEYANTMTSPWGSWGSTAYTQADNPVIAQLAALFGIYGIGFLIYWTAALFNYWYERRSLAAVRNSAIVYLIVMLSVVGYGSVQLKAPVGSGTVRVAAIVKSNFEMMQSIYHDYSGKEVTIERTVSQADSVMQKLAPAMQDFFSDPFAEKYAATRELLGRIEDEAFVLGEQAVVEGAKIVAWSEGQFYGFNAQEVALVQRGREFALNHGVTLFMPMAILFPEKIGTDPYYMKNQIVVINPQGEVVHTYHKAMPVPGAEPVRPGDGMIPVIEAEGARLSPVICYDADFPELIRQTGRKGTQILFIPSGDWFDIRHTHVNMARLRAIENGLSVVRPANNGLTSFIDAHGRIIKQADYFERPDHVLVADVPLSQRQTFYSRYGQWFVYAVLVLGLLLIADYLLSLLRPRR